MPVTKAILDWRTDVQKYVKIPDSLLSLIDDEVRETVRDFCENTQLWQYDLDRISTVALQREYAIATLPAEGGANEFVSIVHAKYKEDGQDDDQFFPLRMGTLIREEKIRGDASWQFQTANNPFMILVDSYEENFILHPIPDVLSTEGLLVRITVKPTNETTEVPLFIWDSYKRTISLGAASRLMGQGNKPWSNQTMSRSYDSQYQSDRNDASYDQWSGRTNRTLQVRPRFWGHSRSQDWIF